jgi:hypothetical protein
LRERVDLGRPKAHVAAEAGISRQCLSEWHCRRLAEGEAGLTDGPVAGERSLCRLSMQAEQRIERLRQDCKLGRSRPAGWCNSVCGRLCGLHHAVMSSGVATPSCGAGVVSRAMVASER